MTGWRDYRQSCILARQMGWEHLGQHKRRGYRAFWLHRETGERAANVDEALAWSWARNKEKRNDTRADQTDQGATLGRS